MLEHWFEFLTAHRLPLREWADHAVFFLRSNYRDLFRSISGVVENFVLNFGAALSYIPAIVFIIILMLIAWKLAGRGTAVFTLIGLLLLINLNLWDDTMLTLALVLTATSISLIIGIPLGILASRRDLVEKILHQIDDYGHLYNNARIGLVVPEYVDISSIEELNDHVAQFDGRIVGIDGGAGIMSATEQAIDDYALDLELVESSDMAMTAALADAYMEEEWIVVTGWTPHWKFAEFDLKFLEDPKGIYGGAEDIHVMARQGLSEDAPEVAAFLKNYYLEDYQLGEVIGAIADGAEPLEAAREWLAENEAVVEGWLQ